MNEEGFVTHDFSDGVGQIEFFHPKGNSLPKNMLEELTAAVHSHGRNPEVKVIVIKSVGERSFCGGASFDEFLSATNDKDCKDFFMGFANLIMAIRNAPKFVVARVQGKVVGGGVGIVAACDYAVAGSEASLRLSELSIGIGPFIIGPAVIRKIGNSAFMNMAIDTEWRTAEWGHNHGIYSALYNTISELDQGIVQITDKIKEYNPDAAKALKEIFWEDAPLWEDLLSSRADITSSLAISDFVFKALRRRQS